jgi:nucleotide-binding universal stress UspA family protein
MHFNHILVTTDFSANAATAFDFAAHEKKFEGAKVTVLSVISNWFAPILVEGPFAPANWNQACQDLQKVAQERLEQQAKASFHEQEVRSEVVLTTEAPGKVITDYAQENGCDLIVMASHGRGSVSSFFIGSTVQRVLQLSKIPVLVVPSKRKA